MKLKIKGFLPSTLIDWEGKVASLIFLPGCNFKCPYCYAGDLIANPGNLPTIPLEEIVDFLKEKSKWIDGVVLCGGEPTIWEELPELIKKFKALSTGIKLDTNGSNPNMLKYLIDEGLIDYVAMDLKAPAAKYDKAAGIKVDQEAVKESIAILMKGDVDYEFRTTVCPGFLNKEDVVDMAKSIAGARRYILQQFKPGECLDVKLNAVKPYSTEELKEMVDEAKEYVPGVYVRGEA